VKGFETIGWTNPNLTYSQCGLTPPAGTAATTPAPSCNLGGGNGFVIPGNVPVGVGNGLNAGDTIDQAFLLAHNPGVSLQQLDQARIPRLGRAAYIDGTRDRNSAMFSMEFRPSENMHFWVDTLFSKADRDFDRLDVDLVGRNGGIIPLNLTLDENNVVTSGTFANAQFFLEARPYSEDVKFYNIDPGAEFVFNDNIKLNVQANVSRSWFFRESPTILVNTPLGQGITVDYQNNGGDFPAITPNVDLNDPSIGWTWTGGRVNIQDEKRVTKNGGIHSDLQFGEDRRNVKVGVSYDDIERRVTGFDNSAAWENAACRGLNPDGTVPNPRPACVGGPLAGIPQSALASYLRPGPGGFITVDFARFMADTNYRALNDAAPESNSSNTGAASGGVEEKNLGFYVETNVEADAWDRPLRLNAGVRHINTKQAITGPVTLGGVRDFQTLKHDYSEILPSFNVAWDVMDDVVLRMSGSRTLTRPDPSVMLPNTNFSDPSAQTATQGNPNLAPFLSTNVDIGGEWYTGDEGYVGLVAFNKRLTGFTVNGTNTIPFLQLGVPFDTLNPTQQLAILQRGGPDVATVTVQQQVNAQGVLNVRGWEATWVQPLDRFFDGFGFMANFTRVMQHSEGSGIPAKAIGISPTTYNATGYWENKQASVRLSYVWNDDQVSSGLNQNGIPNAALMTDARGQWDLSASYSFDSLPTKPQVTLNLINITNEPQRQTFQYDNAAFTYYKSGYSILLGVRGTF
jgi:TonB-dependent receptor